MSRRQEETVAYGSPDSPLSKMDVISVGKCRYEDNIYLYIVRNINCNTLVFTRFDLTAGFHATEPFENNRYNLLRYLPKVDTA